jgi:hypothetical protein
MGDDPTDPLMFAEFVMGILTICGLLYFAARWMETQHG